MFIGGFLGYFLPFINDRVDFHIDNLGILAWLPVFLLFILTIFCYYSGKKIVKKGIENDDAYDKANQLLCLAGGCVGLILPFLMVGMVLAFVNLLGLSPNIFIGELFRRKMITIKKQVDIAKLGEMGIISNTLTEDDCAIMISYSGNNEHAEPMCYIPTLLENKVSVIGITSGGDNYMRKELDCVLTMSSKERLYTKISNFATEESLQYIFNVLFSCYFAKHYQDNNLYKLQNSKILESSRWAVLKSMKDE